LPNIKVLKDKDLEFANSIRPFAAHCAWPGVALLASVEESIAEIGTFQNRPKVVDSFFGYSSCIARGSLQTVNWNLKGAQKSVSS
jgi:hypothetical protein